jgi:uncharacterized membrane protein
MDFLADPYLQSWANLLLRWLHVIAGIAWIGASFYFVALDLSLEPARDGNPRVRGEQWSIHGGGFYHKQKYLVAPERLPEKLHWFKWEAYWTWISGFALFVLLYWGNASTYLIDPAVMDLSPGVAIAISIAFLVGGWVVYDLLCRSKFGEDEGKLGLVGAALLCVAIIAACHIFSGRGAFLQIGAMIGTIMVANVAMVIIPGQRKTVAAMVAGEEPDPKYGRWGKQRSVHNNYLTLPVVFIMIAPHFPMVTNHPHNWAVLIVLSAAAVVVRHFFNLRHAGRLDWRLPAAGAATVAALMWLMAPDHSAVLRAAGGVVPSAVEAHAIAAARCATCHAARPTEEGFAEAPKGVMLETIPQLRRWAQASLPQLQTEAMPPGNLTEITPEERAKLMAWILAGAPQ